MQREIRHTLPGSQPERLPRVKWRCCFDLVPRKQAGHNAAEGLGWPGLNIEYTTQAYFCQRVVPHYGNESPPDQSRTRILRTETMTKSLHMILQHELLGVRMQVHLQVYPRCARYRHPLRHRIAVEVMLEPVRSYVRGTISGTIPCR